MMEATNGDRPNDGAFPLGVNMLASDAGLDTEVLTHSNY